MTSPSPLRNSLAAYVLLAAHVSLAGVLFLSPWMLVSARVERYSIPIYMGYTDFFLYPSDFLIAAALIFGLLAPRFFGRPFQRGPWYLTFPLAALVIVSFLSTFISVDPAFTLYQSFRFLLLFGLYLTFVNTPLSPGWAATPLALAVMVQSAVAILQFINQGSIGLAAFGELRLDPLSTGTSILRYDDVRILRAYGLTDHPNLLGGFLAFALIFVLGYYLDSTRGRVRYLFLVPLALGSLALFYTFSRTSELALFVGVVFVLIALLRQQGTPQGDRLRRLGIAGLVLVAVLFVPVLNNQRLLAQRVGQDNAFSENVGEARSLVERDELIGSANRIFYQHQVLGVGNGALTYAMYTLDPAFPRDKYTYQPPHLVLLNAAAELGLPGGALWLWLMVTPLAVMWVERRRIISSPWLAAIAAAILIMLVAGLFDYYPWFWQSGRIWQWGAWGMFAAAFAARA